MKALTFYETTRAANYCAPLRNGLVSPETQKKFKASYPEIHKRCRETPTGFTYDFDPRKALTVSKEERLALYEELWAQPGFKKWLGNFRDIMTNREANEDFAEFVRAKIRGEGGQTLKDKWAAGPRTYLGLQTAGFPNLFIATNSAFGNYPVCAEMIVEWITDCIRYIREKNLTRISPTPQAEEEWVEHAAELAEGTLFAAGNSWFVGANIPGKKRAILLYANSARAYRAKCAEVAAKGYEGFHLQ